MTPESKCCSLGAGRTTRESRAAAMQQGGKPHAGGGGAGASEGADLDACRRGGRWSYTPYAKGNE